jgi:hypothetical protein
MSDQLTIEVYNNIASGAPPIQVIETEISSSSIFVQALEDVAPINVQVYESTTSGTFPIQVIQSEFTGVPIYIQVQEDYAPVQSVNGKIGWVTIDKNDVGLSNVENISIVNTSGHLQNNINSLSNRVVYTTGYQEISGYKYFSDGLDSNYIAIFPYGSDNSAIISLFNNSGGAVDLSLDNFTDEFSIKLPGRNGTLLTDQDNRILFTSGVQIISGLKIVSGEYPPGNEYSIDEIRESGAYFFIDDAERFQYNIVAVTSESGYLKFGPYSLGKLHKDTADLFFTTNGLTNTTNSLSNEITAVSGELQNQINNISGGGGSGDYYPNSNPSGFITGIDLSAYVTKSSGVFTNRPTVNGTGVLLSGEAAGLPTTILYTTGNQIKSGRLIIGDDAGSIVDPNSQYTLSLQTNSPRTWLEILNNSGANKGVFFGIEGNNFEQYNWQGGDIIFFTAENVEAGFARLIIKNDGKVGIGTNSPSEKLEVAGNVKANSATFNTRPIVNGTGVLLSGEAYSASNPSGFITGIDLSSYATNANLNLTGSTLNTKINSLSGSAVLLYGDQTIDGTKTFRNSVYIHDLYVTGTEFIANVENNFIESPYILLNLTGGAVDGGIFFVTGTGLTGINDYGPIIGFDHTDQFKFGIARRSDDLSTLDSIAGISDITNYSGFANNSFYLKSNPSGFITGIDLSAYAQIQQLNDLQPDEGGIIVLYAGGLWDSVSNNVGFNIQDGDLIIYRNGSPIAGITPQDLTSYRSYLLPNSGGTIALIGNVNATGLLLNQKIDNLSGYSTGTFATINNLNLTGNTMQQNIDTVSGNLGVTGQNLQSQIDDLSVKSIAYAIALG